MTHKYQQQIALDEADSILLRWGSNYSNLEVVHEGRTVGQFQDKAELMGGKNFVLPNGKRFMVVFTYDAQLAVWHNGTDVASKPEYKAYWFQCSMAAPKTHKKYYVIMVYFIVVMLTYYYETITVIVICGLLIFGLNIWLAITANNKKCLLRVNKQCLTIEAKSSHLGISECIITLPWSELLSYSFAREKSAVTLCWESDIQHTFCDLELDTIPLHKQLQALMPEKEIGRKANI